MLAIDVRALELGIVTALTLGLATVAIPRHLQPGSGPTMPAPSPEPVAMRQTQVSAIACDEPGIQTIVFKGRVHALDPNMIATFHFRFADLPDRYSVMTGAQGEFEVRFARDELGITDLCSLPTAGLRSAAFRDSQLSIEYVLQFER